MTRPLYIVTSLAVASVLAGCFRDVNSDQDKPIVRVDTPLSEEAESTILPIKTAVPQNHS